GIAHAPCPRTSLTLGPSASVKRPLLSPATPESARIAGPKPPSLRREIPIHSHPLGWWSLGLHPHKRPLASKCSLSRCPKSAPERLPPPHTGSSRPAVVPSSVQVKLPAPIESQTRAAVPPPWPTANSPRWCTRSAEPAPPSQTAPSAPAP